MAHLQASVQRCALATESTRPESVSASSAGQGWSASCRRASAPVSTARSTVAVSTASVSVLPASLEPTAQRVRCYLMILGCNFFLLQLSHSQANSAFHLLVPVNYLLREVEAECLSLPCLHGVR